MKFGPAARRVVGKVLMLGVQGKHSAGCLSCPAQDSAHGSEGPRGKKVAVLFDAENLAPSFVEPALQAARREGEVAIAKVYGPQQLLQSKGWAQAIRRDGLDTHVCAACVKGKNSVDMHIATDGLRMVIQLGIDVLAVVSNDCDFAPLACHVRGQGKRFHGMGTSQASCSYVGLCDAWTDLGAPAAKRAAPKSADEISAAAKRAKIDDGLLEDLAKCAQGAADKAGWANLSTVTLSMRKIHPDFAPKLYGYPNCSKLVRATELFDVRNSESGCYVRLRAA